MKAAILLVKQETKDPPVYFKTFLSGTGTW